MKTAYYIIIGLVVLFGIFLLIPRKSPMTPSTSTTACVNDPSSNAAKLDPTTFTQVSATTATLHTVKGDITIALYPNDAPKTVTNFATLAKNGYYNGLTFHRVEPGFVIQGGDPNADGTGGSSIYGPTFADELNANTASYQAGYQEGVLAMANAGPNTNGSQFFIMLADNDQLPKSYTIFGKVTAGLDVVHNIVACDVITSIDVK